MKKLTVLLTLLCAYAAPVLAANIGNDFRDYLIGHPNASLSDYNKDISTMIGVADFHTGQGTSFPGFDIGATLNAVKTSSNFSSDDYMYTGFLTAETKIPFLGLGVMVRGTDMNGFNSLGGGLKYTFGLFDTIHISTMGFYDKGSTDYYNVDHYSLSATASLQVLFLTPYVGIGYDYSDMETKDLPFSRTSSDSSVRYTAGVNVKPFPFVYMFGAYTKTSNNNALQGGVGINF